MIATTHYTLESYNISQDVLGSCERCEIDCTVKALPSLFTLFRHGSKDNAVYSRALKTIDQAHLPKLVPDTNLVSWSQLNEKVPDYDLKTVNAFDLLERTLTAEEKGLLLNRLKEVLSNAQSVDERTKALWLKCGLYKPESSELTLLLLQRNTLLNASRTQYTVALDETLFPKERFSVTTCLWVPKNYLTVARKVASLLHTVDSSRLISCSLEKSSSKNSPAMQITKFYESAKHYLGEVFTQDVEDPTRDVLLDLLIQITASKSTQNYWQACHK